MSVLLFCWNRVQQRGLAHRAEVGFGVGADVGEAGRIGHVRGLASFGVGPALALLEFHGVVIEQLIDGDGGENERSAALQGGMFVRRLVCVRSICRAKARRYVTGRCGRRFPGCGL
jgi:hypothetical protein